MKRAFVVLFYIPQMIETVLYTVTANKNIPSSKKYSDDLVCLLSLYSFDVINIVIDKHKNIIGIVISKDNAFVTPKMAKATVNEEKQSFKFRIFHSSRFNFYK